MPLKIRSLVGLIPSWPCRRSSRRPLARHARFSPPARVVRRTTVPTSPDNVACMQTPGHGERRLLAILDGDRLRRVSTVMLDEREFLSPFGIRAISADSPGASVRAAVNGMEYRVDYEPGE